LLTITLALPDAATALQLSTDLDTASATLAQQAQTKAPSSAQALVAGDSHLALSENLSTTTEAESQQVVAAAMELVGTPYRYGQNSSDAVDCSAMVQRAFESIGLELPRSSLEMLSSGRPVNTQNLVAGDVLIYRWGRRQLHATLYLGNDTIIHASPEAGRVIVTHLDARWHRRLVAARRVL